MAREAGLSDDARIRFEEAVELFEAHGATHPAARVSARLGEVMWDTGRLREALERMDAALALLAGEEADADVAALAAEVGRFRFFAGEPTIAAERIETALEMAESLGLPEVLSQALNTKAMILSNRGRNGESGALVRYALDVALEHDIPSAAFRAYNNVADLEARSDRFEAAAAGYRDGLALARRVGHRQQEWLLLGQTYPAFMLGNWDEALAVVGEIPEDVFSQTRFPFVSYLGNTVAILAHRGELAEAERLCHRFAELHQSADVGERTAYGWARSTLLLAQGRAAEALVIAEEAWELRDAAGIGSETMKEAFPVAVAAAFRVGDTAAVERLLRTVDDPRPGGLPQLIRAQTLRFRAQAAAGEGDGERAERLFRGAAGLFRELATPFPMAVTLLEHAEWLTAQGRGDDAEEGLVEAAEVFASLAATPWLERLERVRAGDVVAH
jgi:tetratricopeptide (TPR) repeat protein